MVSLLNGLTKETQQKGSLDYFCLFTNMTYEMSDLFEHLVIVPIFPTKVLSPSDELSLALRHQIAGFPNV